MGGADGAERKPCGDHEPEEREDQIGVDLGDRLGVQPVAPRVLVARVRPAAGQSDSIVERQKA
jgi:hypothetical protein